MRSILYFLLFTVLAAPLMAAPITYQGQLQQSGQLVDGTEVPLSFQLFATEAGDDSLGDAIPKVVTPQNGLFQVELDFGAGAFDGSPRFLEILVNGTPLGERQAVVATPQALIATTTVAGAIGTSQINATEVQRRVTANCQASQYIQTVNEDGTVVCGSEPPSWRLDGNAGTSSAANFLGTTDNQPLELRTANVRSLRIEPSAELFEDLPVTTNVIAGSRANEVTPGVRGATISGGGAPAGSNDLSSVAAPNRVTDHYGTVGGGYNNQAGDAEGTTSDRSFATVGGGLENKASGSRSTIGGGGNNAANSDFSTISGGVNNTASGFGSTVGGGSSNLAANNFGTVGGGQFNTTASFWSTVAGGFANNANGISSAVGGGEYNSASGFISSVGGGEFNAATGNLSAIGGGSGNAATGLRSTIGGGSGNTASGNFATVGGGEGNCAGGQYSWAGGRYAKVRPGSDSGATSLGCSNAPIALTAEGDAGSFVWADSTNADFISQRANQFRVRANGGVEFQTGTLGLAAVSNSASTANPTLVLNNGGTGRLLLAFTGDTGIPGGTEDRMRLENNGDLWISGALTTNSDRAQKEDIQSVDAQIVLDRLSELQINSWRYLSGSEGVRHIGPMAQDFHAAFGFGVSETTISTVDAQGIAFAAIQALNQRLLESQAEVAVLKVQSGQMRELADRNADLESRLATLEALLLDDRQVAERLQ